MRIRAVGDSDRPHVRNDIELIEMLKKRSSMLRFQAFYLDNDVPLALWVIQGHSVIEAKPTLMEWRKITPSEAPQLYHGTRFCNMNSIFEHGLLLGKATNSGRSYIRVSAVLTTSTKRRVEGDLRDAWAWSYRNTGYDSDGYEEMPLAFYHADSGVGLVIDTQVAIMEGCEFFISGLSAILCKQADPKVASLKIWWATINSVIWRCGEVTKVKGASLRVVLKENPTPPLNLVEMSSSSSLSPSSAASAKVPMNITLTERGGSPAPNAVKSGTGVLRMTMARTMALPLQRRIYAVGVAVLFAVCAGLERHRSAFGHQRLGVNLCGANNDINACMSVLGTSNDVREGSNCLIAEVSRRVGFNREFTTRGCLSKAR